MIGGDDLTGNLLASLHTITTAQQIPPSIPHQTFRKPLRMHRMIKKKLGCNNKLHQLKLMMRMSKCKWSTRRKTHFACIRIRRSLGATLLLMMLQKQNGNETLRIQMRQCVPTEADDAHWAKETGLIEEKKFGPFLDLCVSSLRRGHANLLCIVPILSDVSEETKRKRQATLYIPDCCPDHKRYGFSLPFVINWSVKSIPSRAVRASPVEL